MLAARHTAEGEAVQVNRDQRRRRADPTVMARHLLSLLKGKGVSTRDVVRIVAELPKNQTAARRALATVPAYKPGRVDDDDDD